MPPERNTPPQREERLSRATQTLGLDISAQEQAKLLSYLDLIQRWTQVYNLTSLRNPSDMLTHHLLDCLAILRPLTLRLAAPTQNRPQILDVGSGAGLPGVVVAMLRPHWQITCVDAVAKKASFIRQVATELSLPNLEAIHGRIEAPAMLEAPRRFDLILSRAFASLKDFTGLTRPLLSQHGQWAAMKAHLTEDERREVSPEIELFHVEQLQIPELEAQRCLVWLRPVIALG